MQALGEIRWTDDNGKKHWAEFYAADAYGTAQDTPYEIHFNGTAQRRYARILATVVYVAVDEGPDGKPVFEKWACKTKFY